MNKKVLLVEDNKELALALEIRLKAMGYRLIQAESVASAMSKIVRQKPDVSLIDINLPDGDGFSIAEQIRNNPNVESMPIVFISASKSTEYKERAKDYSPRFLEKPFDAADLIEAIEQTVWDSARFPFVKEAINVKGI